MRLDNILNSECGLCSEVMDLCNSNNFFLLNIEIFPTGTKSRVLFESENFMVIPSVGCFVEGYLLVITKEHHISGISLNEERVAELEYIVNIIKHVIKNIYNKSVVLFEHGGSDLKNGSAKSITHFHLHVVPVDREIDLGKHMNNAKMVDVGGFYKFNRWLDRDSFENYIYFISESQNVIYFAEKFESQLLRKALASNLNCEEYWDWRKYEFLPEMISTIDSIRNSNIGFHDFSKYEFKLVL